MYTPRVHYNIIIEKNTVYISAADGPILIVFYTLLNSTIGHMIVEH